ncbi:S8/S53 family peptidase [Tindallia californiensis]|uniref:Uncharacterized protein n=1 Tax=Tindallia californiensis TaxID=159292 RepID=A0A1H3QG29_9FIRM|nr:hypothetical protein [Tindallia californiensis]SDZ12544.1 hypothetical protein SAMN05192546_10972 [Tindallia californiensis]
MWVRSQDKKKIGNYAGFSVTSNWGSKKKGAIVGTIPNSSFWGNETEELGLYDTKEVALEELEKIQSAIMNGEKVYEMN